MNKKIVGWAVGFLMTAYVVFCGAVYFFPQYFFYNPTNVKADIASPLNDGLKLSEVGYQSSDGIQLYGWIKAPQKGKKMIVYYHGNSYNIEKFYHKLKPLAQAGYGIFMPEYRGFGGINGEITQKGLEADALSAIEYLHSIGYHNRQIVLYGMSLGSHTSSYVAANAKGGKFAGLILEVPFDSLLNVVKQRIWPLFPFELMVKDKYDNIANIQAIDIPLLIMGGSNDKVVPIERAVNLFNFANEPKEMIVYDGGEHSKLFDFANYKDILSWLKGK